MSGARPAPTGYPWCCSGLGSPGLSWAWLSHTTHSPLVPQQGVLLHAAANRGAMLSGGPCCSGHPPHLDPPSPQAPGESCLRTPNSPYTLGVCRHPSPPTLSPTPLFPLQNTLKASKKKKRASFKRKSSKKGLEVRTESRRAARGNRKERPVSWNTDAASLALGGSAFGPQGGWEVKSQLPLYDQAHPEA